MTLKRIHFLKMDEHGQISTKIARMRPALRAGLSDRSPWVEKTRQLLHVTVVNLDGKRFQENYESTQLRKRHKHCQRRSDAAVILAHPHRVFVLTMAHKFTRKRSGPRMTRGGWCMYASANFERLFLGCTKAAFCDQIFIYQYFKLFSKSTRFSHFCTAPNTTNRYISSTFFRIF